MGDFENKKDDLVGKAKEAYGEVRSEEHTSELQSH